MEMMLNLNKTSANTNKHNYKDYLKSWLTVMGPGLIIMLADTDAGCLITAAQSGASFGYSMILPQILLIPILFMVQEITVRLGIITQKGHGELIRDYFGKGWAYLSAATLLISIIGALLTEFIGVIGVGELFGISKWFTVTVTALFLIVIALTGNYRRVEKIGVILGLFELTFIIGLVMVHPSANDIYQGMQTMPLHNESYLYLVAANVGAVIMPWMIFYQQSAVVDKHLRPSMIRKEQGDTLIGTFITQGIMIGFVMLFAATVFKDNTNSTEETVFNLVSSLSNYIGWDAARLILGSSLLGGALVAVLVVALAGAWGITETLKWRHSLNEKLNRKNFGFYAMYGAIILLSAIMALFGKNLVSISITVEVINALMIPIVLGFLLILEAKALPDKYRMHGIYRWIVISLSLIIMAFGLYMVGPTLGIW
ncbi:NRAMP family divalent metal transporter [Apilactobacillus xinyiensis]|uniref:NRAMP family divalent metal transporter n=1 Tax=Apilactobacillus xinyiensis TaxID=2841032 RepID=UPI003570E88D